MAVLFAAHFFAAETKPPSDAAIDKRVEAILKKMTIEEKIDYIGGVNNMFIRGYSQYGIPRLKMSDGPLGVRTWGPSTAYPAGIAMAAAWDKDLEKRLGAAIGQDARARGVNFLLAPGVNIYRAPLCGRNFEYFGEDPYLASRMAVAFIEGVQGQGVAATVKHYLGNNQEWDRFRVSSDIDERTLREIYLPAFEAAVKEAKVGAVMDSYNLVNGVHMTENGYLNIGLLRQEWGFGGILMSDWGAAHDPLGTAVSGPDLEMPDGKAMSRDHILALLKAGSMPATVIDEKVRRILRTAIRFGFFDRDQTDKSIPLDNPASRAIALEAARASMVLLKNQGNLLPLQMDKLKTIAVIGPHAAIAVTGGGGSSEVLPFSAVSPLDGIKKLVGSHAEVVYGSGLTLPFEVSQTTPFYTDENRKEPGLKAEYFDHRFEGSPGLVRTDQHIHFRFKKSYKEGGADHFVVRWTGYYFPTEWGGKGFHVSTGDGYRLYVDDKLIAQDWPGGELIPIPNAWAMQGDEAHKVVFEFFKYSDDASVDFGITPANNGDLERARALAEKADVVILCVGFDSISEKEGADRPFRLPRDQEILIRYIVAANKKTIVVLNAGGAVDMTGWLDQAAALIHTWYPGQEGGTALAQILFGQYSPSGKLPVSFERRAEDSATFRSYHASKTPGHVAYSEGVFLGYRQFDRPNARTKPLFPFGFGLSYTTFHYSNLQVAPGTGDAVATVSFDVKNTGTRQGAEVAELYVGDKHSHIERPVKELKGFAKVDLKPGETRTVRLTLDRRAFSYFDPKLHRWTAEPGDFSILVGSSSAKIELEGKFTLPQ
jgi:beta-glucosidase